MLRYWRVRARDGPEPGRRHELRRELEVAFARPDPATGKQRVRIDEGHIDKSTGKPYDDPRAAAPHVHGYGPTPSDGPEPGTRHAAPR